MVLFFISKNSFVDFIGVNSTLIISVVIFVVFFGVVVLKLLKDDASKGERVLVVIDIL